jgi:hypothetical protein
MKEKGMTVTEADHKRMADDRSLLYPKALQSGGADIMFSPYKPAVPGVWVAIRQKRSGYPANG